MDVHFLNDCKIIITDELLQQYDLLKIKCKNVVLSSGYHYHLKQTALKNNELIYYYSEKSTIKDFGCDYACKILSMIEINKNFNVNDYNENEFDKYINDIENISINLPDLKIEGLTIPMYVVNQKINNLSSFLAAYEQIDPKFAIRKYKRSGDFHKFSVLSFVLHNFLLDIESINENFITNYIESLYVIFNNLDCQSEQKREKILHCDKVDNLQMLDSIIKEINNHKEKFEKSFIDKKIAELNDLRNRYLSSSSK